MMKQENFHMSVDKNHMKEPNYNVDLVTQVGIIGEFDPETETWVIEKKALRKRMMSDRADKSNEAENNGRNNKKMSYYKFNAALNVLENLGLMKEDGKLLIFRKIDKTFLKLTPRTIYYCGMNLPPFTMKIYFFLLNKWNRHVKYGYNGQLYRFSKKTLLEMAGIPYHSENLIVVTDSLNMLKKLGLISFNGPFRLSQQGGSYYDLTGAWQKNETDTLEELIEFEVMYNGLPMTKKERRQLESDIVEFCQSATKQDLYAIRNKSKKIDNPIIARIIREMSGEQLNELSTGQTYNDSAGKCVLSFASCEARPEKSSMSPMSPYDELFEFFKTDDKRLRDVWEDNCRFLSETVYNLFTKEKTWSDVKDSLTEDERRLVNCVKMRELDRYVEKFERLFGK